MYTLLYLTLYSQEENFNSDDRKISSDALSPSPQLNDRARTDILQYFDGETSSIRKNSVKKGVAYPLM